MNRREQRKQRVGWYSSLLALRWLLEGTEGEGRQEYEYDYE
ncbi:MAG: hypothetical protein AAF591_16985 [Verrucomicrobiota bacterium]